MTEPAPPARPAAPRAGRSSASQAARGPRRSAGDPGRLVLAIEDLLLRIDAVWNEAPETLAMLAEWADALQAQRRDLWDAQRGMRLRPAGRSRLLRLVRKIALDKGLVLHFGSRLGQIERLAKRLRAAQADAATRSDDPAHRAMLDRHLGNTEWHLARLRERLRPRR